MWLYLIIFAIPFIAYIQGKAENRNNTFLILYSVFLAFFIGMSDMFGGYDRYIYGDIFDRIADSISAGENPLSSSSFSFFESGYSMLSTIIGMMTENRYIFILTITLIIYYNVYKVFKRHLTNYPFAFTIFLGMIFFFTFTYLRQVLAFTFAWLSIKYLLDRKRLKFFVMIAITALMHKSGIVLATMCFMPVKKWTRTQIILTLVLCGIVGLSGVTSSLYDAAMTSGVVTVQGNNYNAEGSARIAYVLEVIFFAWIILKYYDRIEENRQNLIFLNMAWAFCATLLLFVRSSDGGRVAWFFTVGIVYIITLISTNVKQRNNIVKNVKSNVGIMMIVVMLLLYIRIYYGWNTTMDALYPYKTFLTNGRRNPDRIMDLYEYDNNYEKDKFYRPAFRFITKE